MPSNPFQPLDPKTAPKATVTDYHKDGDKYIITYEEVESVKILSDKEIVSTKDEIEKDFIVNKKVKEVDRVDRQKYLDSQAGDVGILNIIEKVRLSGDMSLLDQTHRVSMLGCEKDALGHDVEPIVDVTKYQVDRVVALESYKSGAKAFNDLDPELKKKLSLEQVAKMSDAEIDAFLAARVQALTPKVKEGEDK